MAMSEITTKLKYDVSDALRRMTGKLSFRRDGAGERSSGASKRSGSKKQGNRVGRPTRQEQRTASSNQHTISAKLEFLTSDADPFLSGTHRSPFA